MACVQEGAGRAVIYVLVALALTTPPSLAFAFITYISSTKSANVSIHKLDAERRIAKAYEASRETSELVTKAYERIYELERRCDVYRDQIQEHTQQVSRLADRQH